ncbi:MAG: ABC transporter ATP-binding protein, partial [Spirochaetales bacterium]|nr:ABC transporter ATP-binding protein [Spirochaetales bacterium]
EGTPFSEIEPEELRRKVALVSDISSLFQGTIRENLLMAAASDEKISDKKMFEALAMARLDLFVEEQPHGLDTNIGEGGNRLSGGQKQRLVLARAFLQNTKYILLDEASSNVDRENEILLGHAVSSMAETRGILIICHESAWIEQLPGRHMILGEGRVEPHKENKENKEPLYAQ